MEHECNDYLKLTRDYLKNYRYYCERAENLKQDICDLMQELRSVPLSSPVFGAGGGGARADSSVEREAALRIEQRDKFDALTDERAKLVRQIRKLKSAMNNLPKEEQDAVRLYYFDRMGYDAIMCVQHWSNRTCARRVNDGVRKVALMLFGEQASQPVAFAR